MSWTKVSDGHYERPLGANELFIKKIGDGAAAIHREHWSVTATARFSVVGLPSEGGLPLALRDAWKGLRFQHPSIATVPSGSTLTYDVPDQTWLEKWAASTFHIAPEDATAEDVVAAFQPSTYLTLTFVPASLEIVLHSSHWRTDGIGLPQLIGSYFDILASQNGRSSAGLEWGSEVTRLAPAVEDALQLPLEPTPEINKAVDWCMSTLANLKDAVGVECHKQATGPPGGTRSSKLQLSEAATSQAMAACEKWGISLLGAVHASVAAATYLGAAPENKSKHYTSTMRFSMRPHLPAPYNSPVYASALYTSGYLIKAPAAASWLDNARTYSQAYDEGVSADFVHARRAYAQRVLERMATPPPPPSPPPSEIDVSSMDDAARLVAATYQGPGGVEVQVRSVGLGVETLTRQMYCFVWWFRGRLNLSVVYNEAFYDALEVDGHVRNIGRVLCEELGVDEP